MFCSVGVLLYVCIMNLRPIFARHFKLARMLTTLRPPCGAPILQSALFILVLVSFVLSYCSHKLGFRLFFALEPFRLVISVLFEHYYHAVC